MRDHAEKKISQLNFDYPKVIDAKVLLDVEKDRHKAEIILHCANHIVIEADSTTGNMYTSIDETIHKVARQMRKQKTRMLKSHRPDRAQIRKLKDSSFDLPPGLDALEPEESEQPAYYEDLPFLLHRETATIKELSEDEAVESLELSDKPCVLFTDARNHKLSVIYRREDGDYAVICPEEGA
jgi:putative sigma-54 modulation protein